MPTIRDLRDRWRGDRQKLAHETVVRLLTGNALTGLDLAEIDGRVDLRGLWLVSSKDLPGLTPGDPLATVPTAHDVTWRNLDLSHSTFRIDLQEAQVENVRFDNVGWQHWRATSSTFRLCSFTGSDLRDANFDGYNSGLQDRPIQNPSSTYWRCLFQRTRIGPYGSFGRAILEECRFSDTRFPSAMWFRGADVRRCVFAGSFETVCFGWTGPWSEEPPWLEADLSDASFDDLEVYAHSGPGIVT